MGQKRALTTIVLCHLLLKPHLHATDLHLYAYLHVCKSTPICKSKFGERSHEFYLSPVILNTILFLTWQCIWLFTEGRGLFYPISYVLGLYLVHAAKKIVWSRDRLQTWWENVVLETSMY